MTPPTRRRATGLVVTGALASLLLTGCGGGDNIGLTPTVPFLVGSVPAEGRSVAALGTGAAGQPIVATVGALNFVEVRLDDGREFSATLPQGSTEFRFEIPNLAGRSALISVTQAGSLRFQSVVTRLPAGLFVPVGPVDFRTTLFTHLFRRFARPFGLAATDGALIGNATSVPVGATGNVIDVEALRAAFLQDPRFQGALFLLASRAANQLLPCSTDMITQDLCLNLDFLISFQQLEGTFAQVLPEFQAPPPPGFIPPGPQPPQPPDLALMTVNRFGTGNIGSSQDADLAGGGEFASFSSFNGSAIVTTTMDNGTIFGFRRNVMTRVTELATIDPGGNPVPSVRAPTLSDDGRYLAFASAVDQQVYLRDMTDQTTVRASRTPANGPANNISNSPRFAGDGLRLFFASNATDLVAGAPVGTSIYRFTRPTNAVDLVSRRPDTTPFTVSTFDDVSRDGGKVAFTATPAAVLGTPPFPVNATVVNAYVLDVGTGTITLVSHDAAGNPLALQANAPALSADGNRVVFETDAAIAANDTNGVRDVYTLDLQNPTAVPELVSVGDGGSPGDRTSMSATLSEAGRFVAFLSQSSNLDSTQGGDPGAGMVHQIYVRDRQAGLTRLMSKTPAGVIANGSSRRPVIGDDGLGVVFDSLATNLSALDPDTLADSYIVGNDFLEP